MNAFGGMMEHKLKRSFGGDGITSWIRPVCSCGWVGRPEYSWNDFQHTNVEDQEHEHMRVKPLETRNEAA